MQDAANKDRHRTGGAHVNEIELNVTRATVVVLVIATSIVATAVAARIASLLVIIVTRHQHGGLKWGSHTSARGSIHGDAKQHFFDVVSLAIVGGFYSNLDPETQNPKPPPDSATGSSALSEAMVAITGMVAQSHGSDSELLRVHLSQRQTSRNDNRNKNSSSSNNKNNRNSISCL